MGAPRQFDFKRHIIMFGPLVLNNFADGDDVCSVKFATDPYELIIGADGIGTRVRSNDNSATMEIKLAYTSKMNDALTAALDTDLATPNGDGILPFAIKDLNGTTLHMAQSAWIAKRPEDAIGKKPGPRTWGLQTDEMTSFFGGS
jgi:Protein of unknown function (DUF3277)